jgi:plasminogen activator inhibitor 1 RNA-binding protein
MIWFQRRPNNNDRNTKHGRGERAPSRSGKRAYDRRSGTGRGTETKKEGGGSRNWGSEKNDARKAQGPVDETAVPTLEEVDVNNGEEPVLTTEGEQEPEEVQEVVEEVDNTVSYEEYLKSKARPESELFAPKAIREVENEFAALKPKVAVEEAFLAPLETKQRPRVKEEKKKTVIVPSFKVVSSDASDRNAGERGGRGRGGRGGGGRGRDGRGRDGRGRDGRGGERGRGRGRSGGKPVEINPLDPASFPSLS